MTQPLNLEELLGNKLFKYLREETQKELKTLILKHKITNSCLDEEYIRELFKSNDLYYTDSIFSCMQCNHVVTCKKKSMTTDCVRLGILVSWLIRNKPKRSSLDQLI